MPSGIRCGLYALGAMLMVASPSLAEGRTFAELLAQAKAQAAAGHRWEPPGDNMAETVMHMMDLIRTATPSEINQLSVLLESDKTHPPGGDAPASIAEGLPAPAPQIPAAGSTSPGSSTAATLGKSTPANAPPIAGAEPAGSPGSLPGLSDQEIAALALDAPAPNLDASIRAPGHAAADQLTPNRKSPAFATTAPLPPMPASEPPGPADGELDGNAAFNATTLPPDPSERNTDRSGSAAMGQLGTGAPSGAGQGASADNAPSAASDKAPALAGERVTAHSGMPPTTTEYFGAESDRPHRIPGIPAVADTRAGQGDRAGSDGQSMANTASSATAPAPSTTSPAQAPAVSATQNLEPAAPATTPLVPGEAMPVRGKPGQQPAMVATAEPKLPVGSPDRPAHGTGQIAPNQLAPSGSAPLGNAPIGNAPIGNMPVANAPAGDASGARAANDVPGPTPRSAVLFARGLDAEVRGDFSGARRFYSAAAQLGDAAAARNLGRLYDPVYIKRTTLGGIDANAALAQHWYERALKLGDPEAGLLLEALSER